MCLHKFVKIVTRESAQCANSNSESESQGRLLKFPEKTKIFQRHTRCQKHSVIFRQEAFADQKVEEY